jgi:hypothetical protein
MASIATRHSYRFNYLKSEHWKELRTLKLIKSRATCALCRLVSWNNDVHHVDYGVDGLTTVKTSDLRVLCRDCHDAVHHVMEKNPNLKLIPDKKVRWFEIRIRSLKHLKKLRRLKASRPLATSSSASMKQEDYVFAKGRLDVLRALLNDNNSINCKSGSPLHGSLQKLLSLPTALENRSLLIKGRNESNTD